MKCPNIALAFLCLTALSPAVAKETAAVSAFKRFQIAGTPAPVYYHASHRIEDGGLCETAAVMIHGWGGGFALGRAEEPFAAALANAAGPSNVAPYVIAPMFPRKRLLVKNGIKDDGRAVWNESWGVDLSRHGLPDDDWRGGGDAAGVKLSSFEVVDAILLALGDRQRFPALKRVLVTGFSAGGQFVGRYVAVGKGFVREGVEVRYAAMAPSTELRLDDDVIWHYGLKGRPRYSAQVTREQILKNLSSRRVWRACGTKDVLGKSLDVCPEAMMQGENRYVRFRNMEAYLKQFPEWAKQVSFHAIEGVGHESVVAHTEKVFIDYALGRCPAVGGRLTFDEPAPARDSGRLYYYVPDSLDLSRPVPLLVFLHGGGIDSTVSTAGSYFSEERRALMPDVTNAPFIVAAPSAPVTGDGSRWNHDGASKLIDDTIAAASRKFRIDPDRIFLGGHSMGCYGASHLGQILADRFAGVWLSSGAWWETDFRAFLGTPVYIQHGALDCSPRPGYRGTHTKPRRHNWCGVSFGRCAHELMTRYGVEHVYDEHSEGHSLAFPAAKAAMRRFFAWTEGRRRDPYAKKVALVTPCGTKHPDLERVVKSRWLELVEKTAGEIEVDGIELHGPNIAETDDDLKKQTYTVGRRRWKDGARIIAENLGGNRFKVETENVKSFRIYLSRQMGDIGKPFTVDLGAGGIRTLAAEPINPTRDYSARLSVEVEMPVAADDCTAFVVGRKASATGHVIVGHNNDGFGPMRYAILPATGSAPALQEPGRAKGLGGGKSTALYWQAVYSDKGRVGKATGDVLLNEHGVMMFSNSGGFVKEWGGKTSVMPDDATGETVDGGIGLALRFEVVRKAKSASEGVKIATSLIDRYGYGPDARTFTIADRDEAWILCAVRGRRYVARRCPDDAVMAYPNILPVGRILPGDIVSPGIEARRDTFDFAAAYQGVRTKHDPSQKYRILEFYRVAAGVTADERELPWSVRPAHLVSADDLKRGFSTHAVGQGRESVHPDEVPGAAWPVCRLKTLESVVCRFAADPADTLISLAPGRPCETKYDEFRPFRDAPPPYFATGAEAEKLLAGRLCKLPGVEN